MIRIYQPRFVDNDGVRQLECKIEANYLSGEKIIRFSVNRPFEQYLTPEVCDAFLLATLLPAVKYGEDITILGDVSEKLYFNCVYTISNILQKAYNGCRPNIIAKRTVKNKFDGKGVGCGCSLGIDSLAAIFTHYNTPDVPDYQITHLTFFNVGSHGYKDSKANRKSWLKDMVEVDEFALKIGLPVVKIESNIWELFPGFNFDQSGNMINMSTVLTMQKLFGKYLYGSNYPITATHLTDVCSGYFESLMIPISSTESTELIVANADMARSQKTEVVVSNPLSRQSLYVCWKELIVNNNPNHPISKIKDKFRNCTRCDKCLRTCMQLDILGKLDYYKDIFDIEYFYKTKDSYLGKAIAFRHTNEFYRDICSMAQETNYHIPVKSKLIALLYRMHIMGVIVRIKNIK